jgi:malyl-CoA/(S)-citramalyl-CoA lyase
VMVPKVEGPWDIHFIDRMLAQLEAKYEIKKSLQVHAILETALGVSNVESICAASPRMQGISLGPADLAASRRMKTTRVGGGHPSYQVIADPDPENSEAPRVAAQQDPWHYTMARMVDACNSAGILPFYGPFGAIEDPVACQYQFRAAFLMGCVGAWTLHPSQIEIARREFSPTAEEVDTAKRIIEAMGDGTGTVMLDGRMQDDATFKQAQVMVQTAKLIAKRDKEYAELYGL